ncbi:hypothetical protein F4802DRAFT_510819 [Xylaria palmicola]|nr:hypothetical protein F4802DRAFT_510819 [Xylaria palmicola]
MPCRILLRRLRLLPSPKPKGHAPARLLRRHGQLARPQLPFLSTPLANSNQFRYLTTERKRWLAYEVYLGFKWTLYFWAIIGCSVVAYWSVQEEWLERNFPTPHEWRFMTRLRLRRAKWNPERADLPEPDWVTTGNFLKVVLEKLEDRSGDGAGVEDLAEGGVWIDGSARSGYDITAKSEPWRRGYYEALMLSAKVAEHLDAHVADMTRQLVFPATMVIGPSNPKPQPIPFGIDKPPLEEDCVRAYEEPDTFYRRILTTEGFSPKQRMDAALAYANWLDFKNVPETAEKMYELALSLSSENVAPADVPYDAKSYVLRADGARPPSANIFTALTAMATHKARSEDLSTALPILLSILRARRSLPETPPPRAGLAPPEPEKPSRSPWTLDNIVGTARRLVAPPDYPAPPDDGEAPPARDARERCEEAALDLYIGEIIYAGRGREDGLAWTREAVDLAEEQLHRLGPDDDDDAARKTCRECLGSGLENWAKMVGRLAREEREREDAAAAAAAAGAGSWFGALWGSEGRREATTGRWAAEENVVRERTRRAQEVLDELEAPSTPFRSIFAA